LTRPSQQKTTQIYLNALYATENVYFGSVFLGKAAPLVSSSSSVSLVNQSSSSATQIIETTISYCQDGSSTECVTTVEGSATIPLNSSIFFIHYLLSSLVPPSSNGTGVAVNRSDILIFTPYGDTDYSYAEDDIFTEDYSEPPLTTWDLVGIVLGTATAVTLLLAMVKFYRSSSGRGKGETDTTTTTLSPLPGTEA
jgi:hypothetical protein